VRARSAGGFPLERHNVFFHGDYASEFDDIFRRARLPRAGTVYLCAQDRGLPGGAPAGGLERMLLLVNAPARGDTQPLPSSEIETCEQTSLALLARCGLSLARRQAAWVRTTPTDFAQRFPGTGGALYGPASHGWMALFRRGASASRLPGLFLAGGSVHPGPGVPMAAMSGALAAATLSAHLDSISRSRTAAISGGMSTPSATTAVTR
jgi:1-hydroxycarotenoid 3,4-desaturase